MKNLLVILSLSLTSFAATATEPVKESNPAAKAEAAATVSFKGTIADVENYQPLSKVEVVVSCKEHDIHQRIQTDAQGKFSFANLPSGSYEVSLVRDGYETYTRNHVQVEDGRALNLGFLLFRD